MSGLHYRRLGPWHVVFRDAPGHNAAQLTLHLPEHRTLIAADMLSDIEIPILKQPIAVYRRTLADLAVLAQGGAIETLIPGHGTVARSAAEARARIDRDLAYLDALHKGVADAVRAGTSADEVVRRLEAMDYTGKNAEYSMVDVHQRNVRLAHDGLASSRAPAPRGAR